MINPTRLLSSKGRGRTWIPLRKEEIENAVMSMEKGVNTFVHGPVGAGKTASIERAVSDFNDGKCKAIYVDCHMAPTAYGALREVVEEINANFIRKILIHARASFELL